MKPLQFTNNGGLAWTPEHEALLIELFRAGYNDGRIAAKLGCTRGGVAKRRLKIGLIRRDCRGAGVPDGPTEPVASGSRIDAMFRAAERPSVARSQFKRQPPPTLVSMGEANS